MLQTFAGRKLFCPLCFRSRLSAIRFQEMPGGPVAAVPWSQELLLGAGVSEAAGRPCLLQASSFWVPSVGPYSCTWDVCCSQCLRSLLQALCFRVLSGGPVAVLFPRASGAACRPCSWFLRRCLPALCFWVPSGGPVAAGPSVLGAVCRPIQLYLGTCVSRTMCQCACWWWLSRPKRVCQWSLRRGHFLLEVLALGDMGVLFLRFL